MVLCACICVVGGCVCTFVCAKVNEILLGQFCDLEQERACMWRALVLVVLSILGLSHLLVFSGMYVPNTITVNGPVSGAQIDFYTDPRLSPVHDPRIANANNQ